MSNDKKGLSAQTTMLDLAAKAIEDLMLSSSARPDGHGGLEEPRLKPGEYLAKQPQATRDALKQLKSEDVAKARWPL